ncbi:hypothetical protein FIBSPDRAFT_786227 [Athelia psychrophila]|uniref:F-box domain-containing protein n=1 Tax=Athelia psychrophila TaxID=1759441 RepID=A0A166LV94_9AGAM|nr:hypothetical protein FIBSPDRAFT_786227 [Fibularhizoctonia sp. CBS 109695]
MHRCLSILEIVSLVCEDLATDVNPHAGYSALINLATTCHLMYEPSMNSLWYGLFNMVPLLRCLPEDVWEADDPVQDVRQFELRRPLLPSDWTRFLHHAGRVRSLGTADDNGHLAINTLIEQHIAPESAYHALEMSKPCERLLPKLRRLHWKLPQDELQYMRPFLCPSMKDISIILYSLPSMAERSLLISLGSLKHITSFAIEIDYTALQEFEEGSDIHVAFITPILKDIISSWDRLKTLDIPSTSLTASNLAHIAYLPYLEDLTVELREQPTVSCVDGPIFPALRCLDVHCNSVSMCIAFLQLSQSWTLESVNVTTQFNHLDTAPTMQAFFQILQSHVSHDDLIYIGISSQDSLHVLHNHIIDIATLAPLLPMPHLKGIRISTPHPFSLGDQDLAKIGTAWPNLTDLTLGCRGWGQLSLITPNGLASLINQCRHLSYLSLAIDGSAVDYKLGCASTVIRPNSGIWYMNLQDSRVHDVQMMAAFLSDVMPSLRIISAWSGEVRGRQHVSPAEADALQMKWEEVERAIKERGKVRKQLQERQR